MTIEDTLLIQQLQQKDEAAFDLLFKEYYQELLSFSARLLWDEDAAADIVQDIFLKLYQSADTLAINISIRAYLFRAVRNRCLNYLRDLKVRDSHSQGVIEAMLWSETLPILQDMDIYEDPSTHDLLNAVIANLPERSQTIVRMRLENEYKFSEIAEKLNITTNYAKVQMNRAVQKMRSEFAKYIPFRDNDNS
jgi:RNA polymerase sigma-70 factor (ECF subfamily)